MNKIILSALTLSMMLVATLISARDVEEREIEEKRIQKRGFHFSFISPLGTNGRQSGSTINKFSINLLGGHSYGNTGFELGFLYNVNTNFTKGVQFAGISNFSGDATNAAQFSGVVNAARGSVGAQFAGVINSAEDVDGAQFSGVINAAKDVKGLQHTWVVNAAEEVDGAQLSGVINVADEVDGAQLAGLINVAKKVKGLQLGVINYAEESDGVSIGLINIVKKGGKHEFEISVSDAINTAINYKIGTNKFYTVFSLGVNYLSTPEIEYAYGWGFGTHIDWKKGWGNQLELMCYGMTENGTFKMDGTNLLTQFKFVVSKQFAKHFKVFFGPVLNLTISNYVNPETRELGTSLAPWSMWKNDSNKIRLNSWIGFTAGIRF